MQNSDGIIFFLPRIKPGLFACICQLPLCSAPTSMPNIRVLRDIKARNGVRANEIARRAYLYVARNQTLPPQVRHQAQLQLNTFGRYTRPTTVKDRCSETGRGRGIMSEFALCRVRNILSFFMLCNSRQMLLSFNFD
jgi:small subunit ribosomal protein S14